MAFQQLKTFGQDHPEVFPLDVASTHLIDLIWIGKVVWEMVEVISFQFARDQVHLFLCMKPQISHCASLITEIEIIEFYFTAYYQNVAGSVCDDESHVIRTQTECTNALNNLGFSTTASYWTASSSYIPAGCSIRNGGDNVPHLDDKDGVGNGRSDLIPICKRPGTSFSLHETQNLSF